MERNKILSHAFFLGTQNPALYNHAPALFSKPALRFTRSTLSHSVATCCLSPSMIHLSIDRTAQVRNGERNQPTKKLLILPACHHYKELNTVKFVIKKKTMDSVVLGIFGSLSVLAFVVNFVQSSKGSSNPKEETSSKEGRSKLKKLQYKFFGAYFLAVFGKLVFFIFMLCVPKVRSWTDMKYLF